VAGVSPLRAGQEVHGVPVFAGAREAVEKTRANTAVIYVPAPFAADAIYEAAAAGVGLVICITEGIPVRDMIGVWAHLEELGERNGQGAPRLLGPNCPGLISPGQSKVGIMPGHIHKPGRVGVVSRSGTLTYEVVDQLTRAGVGQSTCIGIGGDPVLGTSFLDALRLFEADPGTDAVVLIGEIGGSDEEAAARYVARHMSKPVVAFIAGRTAPPGKRMGHAGAIVTGGTGTAAEKIATFREAGVPVADLPSQIPCLVRDALSLRPKRARLSSRKRAARTRSAAGRAKRRPAKKRASKRTPSRRASSKAAKKTTARTSRPRKSK
jgi:succinyl-CoA synthetase alpha subunit